MSAAATVPLHPLLSRDELARLQQAAADFNHDQLTWGSGFLAGLAAAKGGAPLTAASPPEATASKAARSLAILYGSQTGNCKRLAEALYQQVTSANVVAKLFNIADYPVRQLKLEQAALFVISTQGDGDPPEDAVGLFDFLRGASAPRLEKLKFSVLALGDSSYPFFCHAGRVLDERLAELGATRLLPRIDCDLEFTAPAGQWSEDALKRVAETARSGAPRIAIVDSGPRVAPAAASQNLLASAELLLNQRITGRASSKDVRQVEFALDGAALPYEPGDGLAIMPRNPRTLVARICETLHASGNERVDTAHGPRALADALECDFELTLLSRQFLLAYQAEAHAPQLAALLAPTGAEAFAAYISHRQVIDVLLEAPTALTPAALVAMLRPLARRTYSIASSRAVTPDEAHLLVAVVAAEGPRGTRLGTTSNYLAHLSAGATVELHLEANTNFRLPTDDAAPLIMIGPGTGVAPFRAFVQERAARAARGANWLFFGERSQREDFLYQLEWQKALADGTLQRIDLAFSRDQAHKIYVQDRLLARAHEVYDWLEQGAYVYVCGDAKHMAKDVHAALLKIIQQGHGGDDDAAREYLQTLQRAGRYRRDVY